MQAFHEIPSVARYTECCALIGVIFSRSRSNSLVAKALEPKLPEQEVDTIVLVGRAPVRVVEQLVELVKAGSELPVEEHEVLVVLFTLVPPPGLCLLYQSPYGLER